MDDVTLRELVDEMPTQSLELFVQHYEAGEVGGFDGCGIPGLLKFHVERAYCPCAALGVQAVSGFMGEDPHPAHMIEHMALYDRLDTAELYSECVLAIAERDASLDDLPQPERGAVGANHG